MSPNYHHGDLRAAVVARAIEIIAAGGVDDLSIRAIAADLGVSHTAPRHHFRSREGVLSAVAAQGFGLLADALIAVRESGAPFVDMGVAYVDFALSHRAHFRVMFDPEILDESDDDLRTQRDRAFAELRGGVDALAGSGRIEDAAAAVIAGWSLTHGIAQLALSGNLDDSRLGPLVAGGDVSEIARRAAGMLYGSPERPAS